MSKSMRRSRLLGWSAALVAAFAAQPVAAQLVSNSGTGSAVFVPYYTINDGWNTLVNITNTSPNSLAIKFRLHEARNSRDVLDFNVALSPFDVWTAFVSQGVDGRPRLSTTDRSCTIPISVRDSGASASELAYSGTFRDHAATNNAIERMSEGYIEILVMGETSDVGTSDVSNNPSPATRVGSTAWFAKHVNGEPRNCNIVQNDFVRRSAQWVQPAAANSFALNTIPGMDAGAVQTGSGSPLARLGSVDSNGANQSLVGYGPVRTPDSLKVNVSLVNQSKGTAGGIESLHVFGYGLDRNLMTAQQFPWFLEPTLASSNSLWSTSGLFAVNFGLAATEVKNEWTSNLNTGATADWVVTFPTKRFQADHDARNIQAACNVWRNSGTNAGFVNGSAGADFNGWSAPGLIPKMLSGVVCPQLDFPTIFQEGNDGRADLVVVYDIYDREEGSIQVTVDGPVVSPAPPPDVTIDNLPYEVNVLKIGRNAASLTSSLDSLIALSIDTSGLASGANVGWLNMTFQSPSQEFMGYAVTGFIYKKRDFGNPALNFGQATEHGYRRSFNEILLPL